METGISSDNQDKVIFLSVVDDSFVGQLIRKKIEPRHFSSDIRQLVIKTVFDFYDRYKKAPQEDLLAEIELGAQAGRVRPENLEAAEDYLAKIFSMAEPTKDYIVDQLDMFVKKRIVSTATNTLLKLQDRFGIDPDRPIEIMREALMEADNLTGNQMIESLRHNLKDGWAPEVITRFGIDPIDRCLGGGLRLETFMVIQGYTGRGKSWLINHLAKMAVRFGVSPLVIPTEMSNNTAKLRFKMSFSGLTKKEVEENVGQVRRQVKSSMLKGADIFLLSEEEKGMRIDALPSIIEEIELRTGKKLLLVLLDSADEFQPPQGRYNKPIEETTAIYTYLKNLAKNKKICIVTTTQAQRIGETKEWLGSSNVGDNINKIRKATVSLSVNGNEEEVKKGYLRLYLYKNTDGPDFSKIWFKQGFEIGQFATRYGFWERITYKSMLESAPEIMK